MQIFHLQDSIFNLSEIAAIEEQDAAIYIRYKNSDNIGTLRISNSNVANEAFKSFKESLISFYER